jgi:hypothetical protein
VGTRNQGERSIREHALRQKNPDFPHWSRLLPCLGRHRGRAGDGGAVLAWNGGGVSVRLRVLERLGEATPAVQSVFDLRIRGAISEKEVCFG